MGTTTTAISRVSGALPVRNADLSEWALCDTGQRSRTYKTRALPP